MTAHPNYPPHNGDPQADRCVCGGIRHWHAIAPYGCDDCSCEAFTGVDAAAPLPPPPLESVKPCAECGQPLTRDIKHPNHWAHASSPAHYWMLHAAREVVPS